MQYLTNIYLAIHIHLSVMVAKVHMLAILMIYFVKNVFKVFYTKYATFIHN